MTLASVSHLTFAIAMLCLLAACTKATTDTPVADDSVEHTVTITANVPPDAPTVYVAGNLPALGPWHPRRFAMDGSGERRTATIRVPDGHALQYKITAGSWEQEGLGPSGTVMPAFTATITADTALTADIYGFRVAPEVLIEDWQGSGVIGSLVYWKDVESAYLDEARHVVVWLPPGYDAARREPYAVIYMHDGQNLFDPRLSYTNTDWGVDEAMMRGVERGEYDPAIIVGVWNTPQRVFEYSPWHRGPDYARFLIDELMPRVEAEFHVATDAARTYTMGSSMGGLISLYLVQKHADEFSACGCVSTHLTWSEQMIEYLSGRDPAGADPTPFIIQDIARGAEMPAGARLYFDYGTEGLDADYAPLHGALAQWLEQQGYVAGDDLKVQEFDGADHSERAWRARVGAQLAWLLGTDTPTTTSATDQGAQP